MNLPPLVPGIFVRRVNRFRAQVLVEHTPAAAHVPNSGRLHDLFRPGVSVYLHRSAKPDRKTPYDLLLVDHEGVLVSIDARLPPKLLSEALTKGLLDPWLGAPGPSWEVRTEPAHGVGRLDLHFWGPAGAWWIETKSVTLVEGGWALFPDAPTARGRRHLQDLCDLVRSGQRAAVVFVIQRPDAKGFAPHPTADPAFPAALQAAAACGVQVRAYATQVSLRQIAITHAVPVRLNPPELALSAQ